MCEVSREPASGVVRRYGYKGRDATTLSSTAFNNYHVVREINLQEGQLIPSDLSLVLILTCVQLRAGKEDG